MGKRYLIDSNSVIDFLGGKLPEPGKQLMSSINPEISVITVIEIQSKKDIPEQEILLFSSFVNFSTVYSDIDEEITKTTIAIRKRYGLKTPDAIIAATAIVKNLILISRKEKDFCRINSLVLINPWNL